MANSITKKVNGTLSKENEAREKNKTFLRGAFEGKATQKVRKEQISGGEFRQI